MVGFQETDATIVKRDMRYSVVNFPFKGCQQRSEKLCRVRGTAKNMGVFNSARLGKNRGLRGSYQRPKVPVFPEVRLSTSQMVRLEGGGCRASQLNERNGGKGYDSDNSLFGWTE